MKHVLTDNIAQLEKLDASFIDGLADEIRRAPIPWNEPYPEYASDGLKVATLLNPTGEQFNFDYKDCRAPKETDLLKQLPSVRAFLQLTGFDIMGSRLLRLDPGTFLHEHRDFVYLEDVGRYRLHLPIITNPDAFIIAPGIRVHFKRNFLWKLNPKTTIHSACNFGSEPRIHLMIDCYINEPLEALVREQWLDSDAVSYMPALTASERNRLIAAAQAAFDAGESKQGEEILLRTFCQFNLNEETSYDLLFDLFGNEPRFAERKAYWQARVKEVYMEKQLVGAAK